MDKPSLPSAADARARERAREKLLVSYTIDPSIAPEHTETLDIAIGGMAMLTNAWLAPDSAIIIDLELRGDPRPKLRLSGNVRWSTYDAQLVKYRTGVAFVESSAAFEADLARYIDMLRQMRAL